ncbi:response regulator transcription factor [Anaerosporobacter faecicola]|uniref:response regulator transcription factor n=1 Tax=Anaerosporobacter faecicola TaxID=2718714 RepID=UPI00143B39A5|nr:response regulator transcription factor [Anaerosporobacter faecicola]
MKQILIIDDDIQIGNMLEEVLARENYHTLRAYSGTEALLLLSNTQPDLILLDLMLPGLSGEEVLQKISHIPVIVLSAKVAIEDKVNLLMGGAVDYMTKPFSTKELLARINVQLRKTSEPLAPHYSYGALSLDVSSHEITVNAIPVSLTKTEYAILKLLLMHAGQVIAKSVILDRISVDTPDCTERSLKQHISNLRKKLYEIGGKDYIEAVWGIGFRLTMD